MAVPILQSVVGLIFVLLGIAVAGKPPTTKNEQWLYRFIFVFAGLLVVALSWIQYEKDQRKMADIRDSIPTASVTPNANPPAPVITSPSPAPEKEEPVVAATQPGLQQKYQTLLRNLARDPSIPADARERIIVATAELGKEAKALQQSPHDETRDKIVRYFDYAIKSLAGMTDKEATLKRDKSILSYYGLPEDLSPEAKAGKRSRLNVAEIKFQNNPDWGFQMNLTEETSPKYEASMSITCKGGLLVLRSAGDLIETKVQVPSGESYSHDPASGDAAKANIIDALEKLLVSETDAADNRK